MTELSNLSNLSNTSNLSKKNLILAWLNSEKISGKNISKLIDIYESVENIWDNLNIFDDKLDFLKDSIKLNLISKKSYFEEELLMNLRKENVQIISIFDEKFPNKLRYIYDCPYILYCKGDISCLNTLSIAIIGSRKATSYGKWCAEKFSKELSEYGISIISGLAYGIDSYAHIAALKNNGITIGVIGCGIDIVYPQRNKYIYEEIVKCGGCIISEFPFGTAPIAYNFPLRNRIISGLSDGVLVIEAQEKSGTLITCTHALEQGKDVFAIPGNINNISSIGTNMLIKDGAKLVMNINDILDELGMNNLIKKEAFILKNANYYNDLSKLEKKIVLMIQESEKDFDELSESLECSVSEILSTLTVLELKGIIIQTEQKKFILAN